MIGTVYNRNLLHRLGDAFNAYKGVPTPSQLYPPGQQSSSAGYYTFPGYDILERDAGGKDEARVKTALRSPTVFANVQAIANEIASAELIVKERTDDGLEDVDNHPLELLWEAPNPYMGRSYLMSYWAWSYTLASRAYLYWLPAGGEIQEVWPIPPFMIRALPSGKDFIGGYAFKARPGADPVLIPPEYVTYSHSVNLFDVRDGLSFLAAAMVDINSEIAMSLWNQNFFGEQNGIPDGLITVNKDTLDADLVRIRSELRDFFGGTRRGVAVARTGDMDYKPFGRAQKDVEFKEGLALASQRIGRAMGFPDGYWSDIANKANAEAARATMIAGAVWPLLVRLHEDLNAGVIKRWYGEQYRAEFKDIRPEDRALKLQELTFYAQIETLDELRKRIGSDSIGDVRGDMLIAEIAKGIATPTSIPSQETEDYLAEQEEAQAEEEPVEEPPIEGEPPAQAPPIGEAPAVEEAPVEEEPMKAVTTVSITQAVGHASARQDAQSDVVTGLVADQALDLLRSWRTDGTAQEQRETWAQLKQALDALRGRAKGEHLVERLIESRDADLSRWQHKALKSLKRFHTAAVRFESASILADEHARISAALTHAQTPSDVAQAFKATRIADLHAGAATMSDDFDAPLELKATDATDALIDAEFAGAVEWAKAAKGDEK